MQGTSFIIIDPETNGLLAMGQITRELKPGTYLIRVRGNPPVSRVVDAEHMANWLIFDDEQHMDEWMKSHAGQEPVVDGPQEVTPEDLPSGVFDPTSPLSAAEQLADYEAEASRPAA